MLKRKILIVEDETIVAEDIKRILIKHNFEVAEPVSSGKEALDIIEKDPPHLILLDILLEDEIDGIQVADKIKVQNIPFIYVTAFADNEKIEQAKQTMPFGYLLKPFRERELLATIEMALYKHESDTKLKESMENYKRILDNIQDIYYEVSLDGTILQISPSIEEVSSYRVDELINKSLFDIYYNYGDRDVFLAKLTKDSFVTDYPHIFKDKDGTPFTCLCSAKIIIEKGLEPKIIGSLRNISEHLEGKKALKDSEERFKILFDSNPDAVILQNKEGMLDCNDAALTLFDFKNKEDLKGFGPKDFSPKLQPDGRNSLELIKKYTDEAFTNGFVHFNWTYRKHDGSIFPAVVWLNSYKHKNELHLLANIKDASDIKYAQDELRKSYDEMEIIVKDRTSKLTLTNQKLLHEIHERKLAELKAKESEEFYNALFENNPIETIVVDKNGMIVRFNCAVKNNRNRVPKIGDYMYKDYEEKYKTDMYGELINCIKTGELKHFSEAKYDDKFWSITIAPFEKGAIIASLNISDRKFAEEQIMKLNNVFQNLSSDPNANIDYIVHQVGKIINSSCCLYYKLNKNKDKLFLSASYRAPEGLTEIKVLKNSICFREIIQPGNEGININDLQQKEYSDIDPIIKKYGLKSILGFPVHHLNETIGALCAFDVVNRTFTKNETYIMSALTKTLSIEEERLSVLNALRQVTKLQ